MKEEETGAMKEKILSELNDYFEHELNGDIGYDIINEDS